jgi:hypothetical protein
VTTYKTMTVEGSYGSTFTAKDDDDAVRQATAAGYKVLDITELAFSGDDALILVIADD